MSKLYIISVTFFFGKKHNNFKTKLDYTFYTWNPTPSTNFRCCNVSNSESQYTRLRINLYYIAPNYDYNRIFEHNSFYLL